MEPYLQDAVEKKNFNLNASHISVSQQLTVVRVTFRKSFVGDSEQRVKFEKFLRPGGFHLTTHTMDLRIGQNERQ